MCRKEETDSRVALLYVGYDSNVGLSFPYIFLREVQSVPVAAPSKAWVCGRSLSGTVGLNPAGGMDVCLSVVSVVCCQVEVSMLG